VTRGRVDVTRGRFETAEKVPFLSRLSVCPIPGLLVNQQTMVKKNQKKYI
jgi:hypothetical protein